MGAFAGLVLRLVALGGGRLQGGQAAAGLALDALPQSFQRLGARIGAEASIIAQPGNHGLHQGIGQVVGLGFSLPGFEHAFQPANYRAVIVIPLGFQAKKFLKFLQRWFHEEDILPSSRC